MPREDYGLGEDGRVFDSSRLRDFPEDNPEWRGIAGTGMSYESSIMAWEVGAPPPTDWIGATIHGEDDGTEAGNWWVTIQDIDGNTYEVHVDDLYDLAWDYYDAGDIYDYDIEKEIDT